RRAGARDARRAGEPPPGGAAVQGARVVAGRGLDNARARARDRHARADGQAPAARRTVAVHRGGGGARRRQQDGGVVNLKAFFVATLSSALDLGIASPDDVLRHVTPDVLAIHLPRPLWARLLTACVGAPRVDAQLVVETIGVPNLCEHIPAPIIWACIE